MLDEVSFHGRAIEDVTVPGSLDIFQAVDLEFETEVGVVYQIQASDDLVNWENFGSRILGNGQLYRLFTSTRTKEREFFRVRTNQ